MDLSTVNLSMFIPAMATAAVILLLHTVGVLKGGVIGSIAGYANIAIHLLFFAFLAFSNVTLEFLALCMMTDVLVYSALSYVRYRLSSGRDSCACAEVEE